MAHGRILGLIVGGLLSSSAAMAFEHHETFMPDNNLNLQDCRSCEREGGLSEEEFNGILDRAEAIFGPIVTQHGGTYQIARKWDDATVNASAQEFFGTWIINMYGGLARRPEITKDGFTFVVCHEMGHHLSGFPFASNWAANEGQADYFASHVCPKLWWGTDDTLNAQARSAVPDNVKNACNDAWKTELDQNLCYRAALAAKSVTSLLGALKNTQVSFDTHDANEVDTTFDGHPEAQCRLDTYLAASQCNLSWDTAVVPGRPDGVFANGDNSIKGEQASAEHVCTASGNFTEGLRPRCWFKPRL